MPTRRSVPFLAALATAVALAACGDGAEEDGRGDGGGGLVDDTAEEERAEDPADAEDGDGPAATEGDVEEGDADAAAEDGEAATAPVATTIGTVVVDGTEYGISEVIRCEPFEDDIVDRELELIGLGTAADGSRVQVDVYVEELMGAPFDDVSWSGPEGVFGGPDDAVVDVAGDRATGTATLIDAFEGTETLSVSFDLPIPAEVTACR